MDKLIPLDISTLADKDYDIKVDAGPIYTGSGLLDQIYTSNHPYEFYPSIQEPFTVIEVGDYSMIVSGNKDYTILDIRGIEVTESINTPEGTILYFSDKLPEEMKYYSTVYANVRRRRILNMSLIEEMIQKQFVSPSIGGGRNVKMKNNNGNNE